MENIQFEALMDMAIEREVEANTFYNDVAELLDNPVIKKIFTDLAKEEEGHRNLLQEYRNIPNMSLNFKQVADYKVSETVELPKLSLSMKPVDAIALAMKKEQQAVEFYTDLANQTIDSSIKQACLELAKMEAGHKNKLEGVYTDIAYIESF